VAAAAGAPNAARGAVSMLWLVAAALGGVIAGATLRAQRSDALRRALPAILVTALSFAIVFLLSALKRRGWPLLPPIDATVVARAVADAVLYFDVSFVLEEVAFRGVLDPYLLGDEHGANAAWASAIFSSALWGLWHLPVALAPGAADLPTIFRVVLFHASLGVLLCFVSRAAGTLAPAAAVHGLADAFRNLLS
jgi:membrane protease YdiL (CAAX protease family)